MPEYKIWWKMRGVDGYFSTRTNPVQCETQFLDEEGRIFHTVGYKNENIATERIFLQLTRYSEADPEEFFALARQKGAKIIMGDADLAMEESAADILQQMFSRQVKLMPYTKSSPQEVRISLNGIDSHLPEYEEA